MSDLVDMFLTQYPHCRSMEVKKASYDTISVTRTVEVEGENVDMKLIFMSNMTRSGNSYTTLYDFLKETDFFVSGLYNGTQDQQINGINRGTGNFTKFIREVVGNGSLYVREATDYWGKRFDIIKNWNNGMIIKVKNKPYKKLKM